MSGKKLSFILASDGLTGRINRQHVVELRKLPSETIHIVKHMGTAQEVVHKAYTFVDRLAEDVVPILVVSAGSRNITVDHHGVKHISNSIINGSNSKFSSYAVSELENSFLSLKQLVINKGGQIAFSFLIPCPSEQMFRVSSNPVKLQKALSEIFVNVNDMICDINEGPTPDIKQFVEARSNARELMPGRKQKKIKNFKFSSDGIHPVRSTQLLMMDVLCRNFKIMARNAGFIN